MNRECLHDFSLHMISICIFITNLRNISLGMFREWIETKQGMNGECLHDFSLHMISICIFNTYLGNILLLSSLESSWSSERQQNKNMWILFWCKIPFFLDRKAKDGTICDSFHSSIYITYMNLDDNKIICSKKYIMKDKLSFYQDYCLTNINYLNWYYVSPFAISKSNYKKSNIFHSFDNIIPPFIILLSEGLLINFLLWYISYF